MLGIWIASVVLVGALFVAAAHVLERAFRSRRRWLWCGVLAAGPLVPLIETGLERVLPSSAGLGMAFFGPAAPVWGAALRSLGVGTASGPVTEEVLAASWITLSLALWVVLVGGIVRVRSLRRRWKPAVVEGTPVLLSRSFGPAVVGLSRPEIVLPDWVLGLPREDRELILAHESEHRRRGDPALLAAGFAVAAAMPWNVAAWWSLFRLRDAVETDCDARVLHGRGASRGRYAQLLFEVGSRSSGFVPLGAGFGERASSLERRIREMLDANPGRKRLAVKLAVAGVLLAAACTVGTNLAGPLLKSDSQKAQADLAAAPTFTPYTVAPSIINKQDVQTALEKDYPPLLRDAGIGGTVKVMFFIDETGTVQKVLIGDSSGHPPIDEAALKVARAIRFKPAQNRGKDVPVWVTFPITFQVH